MTDADRDPQSSPAWWEQSGNSVFGPDGRRRPADDRTRVEPPPPGGGSGGAYDDRTLVEPGGPGAVSPYGDGPTWPDPPTPQAERTQVDMRAVPDERTRVGGPQYPGPAPAPYPPQYPDPGQYPGQGYGRPPQQHLPLDRRRRRDQGGGQGPDGGRSRRDSRRDQRRGGGGIPLLGFGLILGGIGLACLWLSLLALPWFQVGDQDVTFSDLRTVFTVPETDSEDIVAGDGTEVTNPDGGLPTPGEAVDVVEDEVRAAAGDAAASAVDETKARYLELYLERLWVFVLGAAVLAVVFSTILTPRSFALGLILGFRRLSGFVTVLGTAAHGVAMWIVFTGDGAPEPVLGAWLGLVGLAAVFLASVVGPKRS